MINSERQEILRLLAELSEHTPDIRFGQLIVNLSYMARGLSPESIWDMEDTELAEAARQHLKQWQAQRSAVA